MKRFDKIITKYGAGGLLAAGLIGTVLIVNGNDLFIRIGGNSWHVKKHEVIKQTTDARGLTSVIYKDDKDTFALDYLAPTELDSLICPDCGEANCIYLEIDVTYDTTHFDLLDAILNVCNRRGITDSTTIDNIKANYDL